LFLFMALEIEIGFQTGLGHHRWLFGVHKGRSNEQIRCERQPGAKPQMCHDKRFLWSLLYCAPLLTGPPISNVLDAFDGQVSCECARLVF